MADVTAVSRSSVVGRRRPSGEAPPLPRVVSRSTRAYALAALVVLAGWVAMSTRTGMRVITDVDAAVLDAVARLRSPVLDDLMRAAHALGSDWVVRALGWPTLIALLLMRRMHRLVVLVSVTVAVVAVDAAVSVWLGRMRPTGAEAIAGWSGYAHPSMPVALAGVAVVGALYTLAPAGQWRNRLAWLGVGAVVLLAAARVYLAVDHPTDVLAGLVTGVAIPAAAFRLLTPDEAMPVNYRHGRRAHVDVGGRRGEAIAAALRTQLGVVAVGVEPFSLSNSAGSTPVRISVRGADGSDGALFGKLYANVHLRSDRWYKLARTVMYGRLEDERSFNTVRRLVEYEDHMLRAARDAGLPTPEPFGFVEITPEREYLLVTEFLDGALPLSAEVVDDAVIDDALSVVRRMWNAGLAHRDVKPGNLLVRNGRVLLLDLAFAALRPSPWRQAVDLANMLMTLAVYSTPERVYERATAQFSPDEIAEAFAATRGATVPTQLRTLLKESRRDGVDVVQRLAGLAPPRPAISIQRWTVRRIGLTMGLAAAVVIGIGLFVDYLRVVGLL